MSHLLSCTDLSKSFGATPLFRSISFSVDEGDRIGMVGPNGSGKSTLLRILAGQESPDSGSVVARRGLRVAYLPQVDRFPSGSTVETVLMAHTDPHLSDAERHGLVGNVINRFGLPPTDVQVDTLSGGWRKRVAFAARVLEDPDLLLLDEPTNHLDLGSILWLERFLDEARFSIIVVSHDRAFLENSANRIIEISKRYPDGFLYVEGPYSRYLERRDEMLIQLKRNEASLESVVRRELEWLKRGPKARTTKASARIKQADELIDELQGAKQRSRQTATAGISFTATGRQTKDLLTLKNVSKAFGDKEIFKNLTLPIRRGTKLGIVGPNGAGKSTVLKLLTKELLPDSGELQSAPDLRIATFDQQRSTLASGVSLKRFLAPESDHVLFDGKPMHVASYAKRFLFEHDQLEARVSGLSGGEQARLLVARLMLQPADLLLLDEPTNDLDIETLQALESNLIQFEGAVVLISHDRLMMESVCNVFLAIEGGDTEFYATFDQWLEDRARMLQAPFSSSSSEQSVAKAPRLQVKLPDKERKELAGMDRAIEKAEAQVLRLQQDIAKKLETNVSPNEMAEAYKILAAASKKVDLLYQRWQELEELQRASSS